MLLSNAYLAFNGFDRKDTVSITESLCKAPEGSSSIIASTPSRLSLCTVLSAQAENKASATMIITTLRMAIRIQRTQITIRDDCILKFVLDKESHIQRNSKVHILP